MKTLQNGFTLIELVMVIVILGVLAAVALPKFIDLKGDAQLAALQGVAGALSSASAINYASRKANSAKGVAITTCATAANALQGSLPATVTISTGATVVAVDASVTCTLQDVATPAITTSFTAIGIL